MRIQLLLYRNEQTCMQLLIECVLCGIPYIALIGFGWGGLYLRVNEWVTVVCVFVFQCKFYFLAI